MKVSRLLAVPVALAALALAACAPAPHAVRASVQPAVVARAATTAADHTFELHSRTDRTAPIRWLACKPIQYRVNTAAMPAGLLPTVQRSMAIVAEQTGVAFTYAGRTSHVFPATTHVGTPTIYIGFTKAKTAYGEKFGWPGEIGVAGPAAAWSTTSSGSVYEAVTYGRVLLYSGFHAKRSGGGVSWQSLILHEVGHSLNLAHRSAKDQIMHASLTAETPSRYSPAEVRALHRVLQTTGCDYRAWGQL